MPKWVPAEQAENREGGCAIDAVSLRKAEEELGVDRKILRGLMLGLDIPTNKVGKTFVISRRDLQRLRKKIERDAPELAGAGA